jgi:hypothetical protein
MLRSKREKTAPAKAHSEIQAEEDAARRETSLEDAARRDVLQPSASSWKMQNANATCKNSTDSIKSISVESSCHRLNRTRPLSTPVHVTP